MHRIPARENQAKTFSGFVVESGGLSKLQKDLKLRCEELESSMPFPAHCPATLGLKPKP